VTRYAFGKYIEADLREIRDHIAKDSPDSARRLMVRFVRSFRLLARHPELGHSREDLLEPSIRFWPVGSYLIIYVAVKSPVEILGVVHGARDVPAIVNRRAR